MINVALVDDHDAMRKGVRSVIENDQQIRVILEADNGINLITKLEKVKAFPDIVLLDILMPGMNGQETIDQVKARWPAIKFIIYTFYAEIDVVLDMINRGACAYLNKGSKPENLCKAIIAVEKEGYFVGDLVKKEYFNHKSNTQKKGAYFGKVTLTAKEVQFIRLSATDNNYREIAMIMGVSPKTLENYRDNLLKKLNLKSRLSIAIYGIKNGIVKLEEANESWRRAAGK